jgi:putative hemolysin
MLIAQFGRIPQTGEHFDWRNYRFEVIDLDGARIDKILIVPQRETAAADDDSG